MELKPQDTLLAIKYWAIRRAGQAAGVRAVAEAIGVSPGEVSKGARRLIAARLLVEREGGMYAETGALVEWLAYGVRYAYPPHQAGYGRGMPTAWNCPLLKSPMVPPSPPLVWKQAGGTEEGILLQPLHDAAAFAASQDPLMYQTLALVDAVRVGKPRELAIARDMLKDWLKGQGSV